MPIRKVERSARSSAPDSRQRTGDYAVIQSRPQPYQPIQASATVILPGHQGQIPQISNRDLDYFFRAAASLYDESFAPPAPNAIELPSPISATSSLSLWSASPPSYSSSLHSHSHSAPAVLVLWLFRQTRSDIVPIAERFHFGPADRQPLYALTAQPSIRSANELNELSIKRRDPINGAWQAVCTSDIEPSLALVKHGNWRVATLALNAVPVWRKMVSGIVVQESAGLAQGLGLKLYLHWGDRQTLGDLGGVYGLWWASGQDNGHAEAFFVVEQWQGFDAPHQGLIRVKPATKDVYGRYIDPRQNPADLAVIYFHPNGEIQPQLVCSDYTGHVRLDIWLAALMTVMVVETRKVAVVKRMGSLPAYSSRAFHQHQVLARGPMYYE